jgi:hypothetical protein
MRRIKMLEFALRVERYVPRLLPLCNLDVSTCRTKQLSQTSSQAVPPTKLASIQSQMGDSSHKEEGSSGSSPRSEGMRRLEHHTRAFTLLREMCRLSITSRWPDISSKRWWACAENADLVYWVELAWTERPFRWTYWYIEQASTWAGPQE